MGEQILAGLAVAVCAVLLLRLCVGERLRYRFDLAVRRAWNACRRVAIYVDKTQFIVPLLEKKTNSTFFLSRPRRFGKSLFISTIEHVMRGRQDLFKGLYIYDKIKWEQSPVIRLSLDKI